ncbi:MAG TPA: hypothetical protein VF070_00515 [Streptosporangiaceae bacterium]
MPAMSGQPGRPPGGGRPGQAGQRVEVNGPGPAGGAGMPPEAVLPGGSRAAHGQGEGDRGRRFRRGNRRALEPGRFPAVPRWPPVISAPGGQGPEGAA